MRFTDQMGREILLDKPPGKIISLVPSQTELLFELGLGDKITGITKFCIHPTHLVKEKIKIGGTKNINLHKIRQINPDLIIGNKEENEKSQIEELSRSFPVWMSNIQNLENAAGMIHAIGKLTGTEAKAASITEEINKKFSGLKIFTAGLRPLKLAYIIWKKPLMTINKDTFIHHMAERCRLYNVFGEKQERYPEITMEELQAAAPDIILLSSEPYPFKEKHIAEFSDICKNAKVLCTDGEMFSWYGSRLLHAPAFFTKVVKEIYRSFETETPS